MLDFNVNVKNKTKKLKELDVIDSVWVEEDGVIYSGWVMDKTRRSIIVCYGDDLRDFKFRLDKSNDEVTICQNNKILYCNEPVKNYIGNK